MHGDKRSQYHIYARWTEWDLIYGIACRRLGDKDGEIMAMRREKRHRKQQQQEKVCETKWSENKHVTLSSLFHTIPNPVLCWKFGAHSMQPYMIAIKWQSTKGGITLCGVSDTAAEMAAHQTQHASASRCNQRWRFGGVALHFRAQRWVERAKKKWNCLGKSPTNRTTSLTKFLRHYIHFATLEIFQTKYEAV